MKKNARNWRVAIGGAAAGTAVLLACTSVSASAEPALPAPVVPAPVTVTQTVTAAPQAAEAPTAQPTTAQPTTAQPATAAQPTTAQPTTAAALPPATAGTIGEFLKGKGVVLEAQKAADFTALNLVLPMPTGWSLVPDPNVPNAFTVIADRKGGDGLYTSNAQIMVYKLVGDFDPREAISHGYVQSQQLRNWQSTAASMADFGGFPSSIIEGTYRENDMVLNTSRRHVIAEAGSQRYLVSLSVTTAANQAVAAAGATDGIVNGFKVTLPSTPTPNTPTPSTPTPSTPTPSAAPAAAVPAQPAQ